MNGWMSLDTGTNDSYNCFPHHKLVSSLADHSSVCLTTTNCKFYLFSLYNWCSYCLGYYLIVHL